MIFFGCMKSIFHISLLYQNTFSTSNFQAWELYFGNITIKNKINAMSFTHTVKTKKNIDDVITTVTENLKEIGFGVLGTLDFKKILSEKGLEFSNNYKLMEVCHPSLAKQVLEANPDLGLLLPCTIAVYQKDDENFISLARPTALLAMASDSSLKFSGEEIENNLIRIIENSK